MKQENAKTNGIVDTTTKGGTDEKLLATYRKRDLKKTKPPVLSKFIIKVVRKPKSDWDGFSINKKLTKYEINRKNGLIREMNSDKPMYISLSGRYPSIKFKLDDNMYAHLFVHRIYASCYLPIPKEYKDAGYKQQNLTVNHKDGNKHNWTLSNLEWATVRENTIHSFTTTDNEGKYLSNVSMGEKSHLAKITQKDAERICQLICEKKRNVEIAEAFDNKISIKTIQHIRSRECWKAVSAKYVFPNLNDYRSNAISDNTVKKVCELLCEQKYTVNEIAEKCNVKRSFVSDIKIRRARTDISSKYIW